MKDQGSEADLQNLHCLSLKETHVCTHAKMWTHAKDAHTHAIPKMVLSKIQTRPIHRDGEERVYQRLPYNKPDITSQFLGATFKVKKKKDAQDVGFTVL